EIDPRAPLVKSDETDIHQILMNLATNAAHAMENGGRIDVTLAPVVVNDETAVRLPDLRPGLYVRLSVVDQGTGMSPEVARRAFEPFFTTKPTGVGTGLGLSVVRGIVRSHGGALDLASRPGQGTRVDVYLPAVEGEAPRMVEPGIGIARGKVRVLLVDDEDILASLQKRRLEDSGYDVTVHTSSTAALEDFRARPGAFDILITDNTMPHLTGAALAREIHALRPELPILMISGVLEADDPDTLRERGIRGVLRKPHSARELEEAVAAALASPASG
ncbi:MAG TPA: ATP-binding protein, partial [Terriglobales bacterium]|nr:ATP-binding protein [Terriglobales bacterium]